MGSIPAGGLRYIVQAVNGVGLVTLATNNGAYFTPGVDPGDPAPQPTLAPTTLALLAPPSTSAYGSTVTVRAALQSLGAPLPGQSVEFGLAAQTMRATTDAAGEAAVTFLLMGKPGAYPLQAIFAGAGAFAPTTATSPFVLTKQATTLALNPTNLTVRSGDAWALVATLRDAALRAISERTVIFVLTGSSGAFRQAVSTNYAGQARLDALPLPPGEYQVAAYFAGRVPLPGQPLTLEDNYYNPATAASRLTVAPGNSAPSAVVDFASVTDRAAAAIVATGNDGDVDGNLNPRSVVISQQPVNGSVSVAAETGSESYTPREGFAGIDRFVYQVCDTGLDRQADTLADNLCQRAAIYVTVFPQWRLMLPLVGR